nr:uncharacterized protein LOC107454790 isoform X8 [Parasteatoda tepidariorum]
MDISSSFTASVSSTSSCKPKLTIEGELKDSLRFRYKSEKGCHGGLKPVIKLHGYKSYNDIWIKATLYTSGINPTLHCLELEGKDCKDGVGWKQLSKDFTARFDSLAICIKKRDELVDLLKEKVAQNLKKKKLQYDVKDLVKEVRERMKTLNLNSGILCFEAFYCKDERQPVCQKILSQPIYNQKAGVSEDLRIRQLSKCSGLTKGNEDIILLCDKVHKDDVEVIFSCLCVDWSARAHLNPADFHYQFAIPIKTPRFPKNYEQEVSIKLCRKSDGKTGVPMKFRYMPCDDYDADLPLKQKQPNPSDCISMPMSAIKREPSSTPDVHNPNFQDLNGLIKFLKTYNNSEFDAPEIEETEYRLPLVTPESFLRQAEPAAQKEYANQEWRNTSCPEIKSVQILRSHIINFLGEGKAFLKYLPALLSMKDENGNSLLHVVVAEKSENLHLLVKIIKAAPIGLINQTNDAKMTPLHVAVSKGLWKVVRILLMAGANPDIKDTNGNTCTHLAAMHNFPWCLSEILLPLLVKDKKRKHLPNVNLLNNEGFSPLQLAVKKESQICVKLLIQAKANLNIFDEKSCSTPLLLSNLLRFQNPVLPQPSVSNTIGGAKIIQGFVPTIPFTPSQATILPNKAVGEVTPSNLLAKGELFLDCEEETLSAAQLSANDTDWNAFTKEVENVTISSVLNTSQAQEPSSNQTITIISPEKLGPPKTILPKPLNFQSGGPVTIPASSLNQHLIKFNPFPNSPAPSNKTYALKIPEIEKGSLSQSTSNSGPRFIKIVPPQSAAQTATTSKFTGAPQILRLRTENSTGNIQIVNPPTGVMPQIIKIGNQTLQLISATVGQQKVVTVNETAKIPVGVPASGFATVANNQPVVESSSLLGGDVLMNFNDNDVPSLPSFLQTNTSNETAIPMRLEKADESADRMTPKGEVILPLLPKDKAGETESILSDSVLLSASSPSPSGNEEEEIVVDVDLSNVTTVYDDESIPNSASSEQNTVINIPVQCNNDENSETVKIGSKEYQRGQGSFHVNDKQGGENSEIIKIGSNEYIRGNSISILKKDFHALDNQCEVQFNRERMFIESKMSKESPKTPELPSPTTANQPLESGSFLPVIVDVMSAKDGGQAIYACDETAKSSKMSNPSAIDDSEVVDDPSKKVKNQTLNIIQNVKVSKNAPSVLQSFPKVMHKHSIFTLQKSIPVIPEGQEIFPDTRNLFSLKTHTTRNKLAVQSLRTRLKAEDYITNSVWWLIQNHYLPMNPPCTLCGSRDFLIERDDKFHDKYCWICRNGNCLAREPIKRPKFFERFQLFTLEDLLLLTFHWACQSDIEEILADVSLDVETIWNYYKALQELCHNAVIKSGKIGTCPKARIETSVVKLGNYFILGALERFNRFTRLQVIPVNEAFETDRHLKLLEEWLNYNSVLISESKIPDEFLRNVYKVSSDPTFTDSKSNGYHIMNISRYLVRNMIGIFGKVKVQFLHQQIVQGFLNELMWRDRNGKFFDQAFWNILIDIGKLDRETMVQPNPVIVNRGRTLDNDCSHLSPALVARWGRVKTTAAVKENEDIPFIDTIPKSLVTEIEIEEKVPEKTYEKSFTQTSNAVKISRILRDNGFLNILFQDLPEVPGGELLVTPKVLLGIKIVLNDSLDFLEKYKAESISLGLRLSAEGFINSPVRWLVKKGFIRSKAPCYVCHNTSFLRDNPKYEDGCSWLCQWPSCKFENIFKRPHFYARFPMLPIAHMNAMVYHWTVHSEISRITSDAPMEISKLQHVWRSFQVLCSTSLRRKKVRLGGEGEMVEVAMVQFGKLYILGAMERRTKYTLLRTFYVDLGGQIPVFLKILTQWILPLSFVIINATKYVQMPPEYNIMVANTSITDPNDIGFHVLNITTYLLQHVSSMFGHLKAEDVRAEVMQIYLDELMWRERYGRMPSETFYNILGDIFDLETKDKPVDLNINNHSSLQKENVCMFDKLAVRSEKNGPSHESKTCVNDKTTEIQIDLTKLPECRVVLKRLSEEVLKYYDCWGYLRNRSSLAAKEFGRTSSYEKFRHDPSRKVFYKFCESKVSCKNPKTYGKWQNIFDESQPMSEQSHSRLQSFSKSESSRKRRRQSSNEDSDVDGDLRDDASSHSNDSLFSMSSNSSVCEVSEIPYTTRSQKLAQPDVVVKTEKIEPEETRIESLAQKTVKQRTVSQRSMPPRNLKQRTVIPRTITPNLVQKTEIVPKEDTEKELICVECGKNICMDHFMKQFLCMDCKRSVYTTSCCNSFMEHRGYLLFGKRMPRRNQTDKEQYGLHKVITLQDSYYCACGFHSNIGNKLATHMVHCGKSTCFYHAEIS